MHFVRQLITIEYSLQTSIKWNGFESNKFTKSADKQGYITTGEKSYIPSLIVNSLNRVWVKQQTIGSSGLLGESFQVINWWKFQAQYITDTIDKKITHIDVSFIIWTVSPGLSQIK